MQDNEALNGIGKHDCAAKDRAVPVCWSGVVGHTNHNRLNPANQIGPSRSGHSGRVMSVACRRIIVTAPRPELALDVINSDKRSL